MIPYADIIINGNEINLTTVLVVVAIVLALIMALYYARRL